LPAYSFPCQCRRDTCCFSIGRSTFQVFKVGCEELVLGAERKPCTTLVGADNDCILSDCSLGSSATSQQYFSLRINQPSATSQQYFSLRINQHQPSDTSQTNRLCVAPLAGGVVVVALTPFSLPGEDRVCSFLDRRMTASTLFPPWWHRPVQHRRSTSVGFGLLGPW
jgi:hypothetical protein